MNTASNLSPEQVRQIIDCARSYVGTPYQHQGRKKGVGIDCVGLIVGVALECGLYMQDAHGYPRLPYQGQIEQGALDAMDRILLPEPGCVALVRIRRFPQHAGIMTDANTVIHAYDPIYINQQRGLCIEQEIDPKWRERVHSFWRFRIDPR